MRCTVSLFWDTSPHIDGKWASGDYSDVSVSPPYGVIPYGIVSRLNHDEMKRLMIDFVDRAYRFIHTLFDESTGGELLMRLARRDPALPLWMSVRTIACAGSSPTSARFIEV